jgi:hypothetical protein
MVAISEGPGGVKERTIKRLNPTEEGLTGGTQRQEGRVMNLVVEEASLLYKHETEGLD